MAEFPELGKHCSISSCNRLDFLPFCCGHCNQIYCQDHHSVNGHSCTEFQDRQSHLVNAEEHPKKKCSVVGCNDAIGSIYHTCPSCGACICLQHRHESPATHSCPLNAPNAKLTREQILCAQERQKKKYKEAFNVVEEEINGKLQAAMTGKNKETANRLRLMRLKSRAVGPPKTSIPMSERVYFSVFPPESHSMPKLAVSVYVSKSWTVGKAVDSIVKILKFDNKNDEKLRLFLYSDKSIICEDMSKSVGSLIENGCLSDGETLLIECLKEK